MTRHLSRLWVALPAALLLAACSTDTDGDPLLDSASSIDLGIAHALLDPALLAPPESTPTSPSVELASGFLQPIIEPEEPADPVDLRAALGVSDAEVVGVTVDPDTGRRYVLDQFAGIFELADDGSATLLRSSLELPVPAVLPASLWTDFVAMGDDQFALTALSDGYLLDLGEDTMTEYFCYEPGDMPWDEQQLTHSVAFDPDLGVLYAQPITFAEGSFEWPVSLSASIGSYSLEGGQPTAWFNIPDVEFLARGAAVDTDGTLLLGRDDELYRFDPAANGPVEWVATLPEVQRIEGLAVDAERDQLLVVDGDTDLLFTLLLDR